jgi:hypothetical protein
MAGHITSNCRAAAGRPAREHHCTGCDCACHHVAVPAGRLSTTYKQVRIARGATPRRTPEPAESGDVPPGPGNAGAGAA